jgi:hypothetical protein
MHIHKIQKKQEEKRGIRGYHGYLQVIRTIIGSQHLAVPTTKSSIQKRFRDLGIWPRRASVRGRPFPSSSLAAPRLPCARRGGERVVKKSEMQRANAVLHKDILGKNTYSGFQKAFLHIVQDRLAKWPTGRLRRRQPTVADNLRSRFFFPLRS